MDRWVYTLLLALCLGAACTVPAGAAAQTFREGAAAYEAGDYTRARTIWQKLARSGDASSQYRLGLMYRDSQGGAQNDALAATWLARASDQGNAGAQLSLGVLHMSGRGVTKDYAAALGLFETAGEQGLSDAQYNAGLLHYRAPPGVSQDLVSALFWWALAAMNGDKDAEAGLSTLAGQMSREEIARAQRRLDDIPSGQQQPSRSARRRPPQGPPQGSSHGADDGVHPFYGVYISSHYNMMSNSISYDYVTLFPDGTIVDGLAPGWDVLELDRSKLPADTGADDIGSFRRKGADVSVQWNDGKSEQVNFNSPSLYFRGRGRYSHYGKTEPIPAGTRWDTTFSNSGVMRQMGSGGASATFGSAITFRRDGTYKIEGFVSADFNQLDDYRSGQEGQQYSRGRGRYAFDGHRVTLQDVGGTVKTVSCFAWDWDDERPGPEWLYIEGVGRFTR